MKFRRERKEFVERKLEDIEKNLKENISNNFIKMQRGTDGVQGENRCH